MTTLFILAGVGFIINLLGRWLLIQEDQNLRPIYRCSVLLLPGAELVYILLRWEKAKAGSVVCALSFALALPVVGQISLLTKSGSWVDLAWNQIVSGEVGQARHAVQKAEPERLIALKRTKLAELEVYLGKWYALLEQRRQALTDDAEQTRVFNADAAAYHGLLTASKVELAELEKLSQGGG